MLFFNIHLLSTCFLCILTCAHITLSIHTFINFSRKHKKIKAKSRTCVELILSKKYANAHTILYNMYQCRSSFMYQGFTPSTKTISHQLSAIEQWVYRSCGYSFLLIKTHLKRFISISGLLVSISILSSYLSPRSEIDYQLYICSWIAMQVVAIVISKKTADRIKLYEGATDIVIHSIRKTTFEQGRSA